MGRIKTQLIKRVTNKLVTEHGDRFSNDFDENKQSVQEVANFKSKKLRNVVAGYVTRLVKNRKEL